MQTDYPIEALRFLLDPFCMPERFFPLMTHKGALLDGLPALGCRTKADAEALSDEALGTMGLDANAILLLRRFLALYDPDPAKFAPIEAVTADPATRDAYRELYHLPGIRLTRAPLYLRAGYRTLRDVAAATEQEILERTAAAIADERMTCTLPLPKEVRTHIAVARAFTMNAIDTRDELIRSLADDPRILGVGQTGSPDAALIPGRSDIDLFVLCSQVPTVDERRALYARMTGDFGLQMAVCHGGRWGHGDILDVGGIDVMPMYFSAEEMRADLLDILARCPDKEGRFYPVGRLASISTIHVLYERDRAWSALKDLVNAPQPAFFRRLFAREIGMVLDEEDLGRCEVRPEVLFFHQVLENALDHLLQALYALNGCYFPSRKRTLTALDGFARQPKDCGARLLGLVRDGSAPDTLGRAMDGLRRLTDEVRALGHQVFPGDD